MQDFLATQPMPSADHCRAPKRERPAPGDRTNEWQVRGFRVFPRAPLPVGRQAQLRALQPVAHLPVRARGEERGRMSSRLDLRFNVSCALLGRSEYRANHTQLRRIQRLGHLGHCCYNRSSPGVAGHAGHSGCCRDATSTRDGCDRDNPPFMPPGPIAASAEVIAAASARPAGAAAPEVTIVPATPGEERSADNLTGSRGRFVADFGRPRASGTRWLLQASIWGSQRLSGGALVLTGGGIGP